MVSQRGQVEPFHVMELLKAANRHAHTRGSVISLCAGQPSSAAPDPVLQAATRALRQEILGYTDTVGILPLRQAIAQHYQDSYGVAVSPDDVLLTTGSSGALTGLFLAAFDAGDTVAMARPGYPAYRNTLTALGCRVIELDCGPETNYQPTLAMLDQLPEPPAGVIVASPANPTGTIIDADELAAIARWCDANGSLLVSDEIYHGISYGRPCATAWQTSRSGAVVGSFSKYFSMTGWRLGWLLLPRPLYRPVELLLGNLSLCPPALSQFAAVPAFEPAARAELDAHVARYAHNRQLLLHRLPEIGLPRLAPPDGAFYVYADVSDYTHDSLAWAHEVLAATGVAITPGVDFAPPRPTGPSPSDGSHFIRLCFAGATTDIAEAVERLEHLLAGGS